MTAEPSGDVTQLLVDWSNGDGEALDKLMPVVYDELHDLAARYLRRERQDHTLQTTALVNEAYLRLIDQTRIDWKNSLQFYALAARMMRRILVDHARKKGRDKRTGIEVPLDEAAVVVPEASEGMLALDDALTRLAKRDERAARTVELHYFGGLTYDEMAEVLGVSTTTVHRDLQLARAWLYRELSGD